MNEILKAIIADPNLDPAFAAVLGGLRMTDDELFAAIDSTARKVSYYEAAEGEYDRETFARNMVKAELRVLRAEAESRGLGGKVSDMIIAGGYLVAP